MENLLFLGVPILKHITVYESSSNDVWFYGEILLKSAKNDTN